MSICLSEGEMTIPLSSLLKEGVACLTVNLSIEGVASWSVSPSIEVGAFQSK